MTIPFYAWLIIMPFAIYGFFKFTDYVVENIHIWGMRKIVIHHIEKRREFDSGKQPIQMDWEKPMTEEDLHKLFYNFLTNVEHSMLDVIVIPDINEVPLNLYNPYHLHAAILQEMDRLEGGNED